MYPGGRTQFANGQGQEAIATGRRIVAPARQRCSPKAGIANASHSTRSRTPLRPARWNFYRAHDESSQSSVVSFLRHAVCFEWTAERITEPFAQGNGTRFCGTKPDQRISIPAAAGRLAAGGSTDFAATVFPSKAREGLRRANAPRVPEPKKGTVQHQHAGRLV